MDGRLKDNSFARMFLSMVKSTGPEFIHKCPFVGVHSAMNKTYFKALVHFLPTGLFRFSYTVDSFDEKLLVLKIDFTII